MMGEDKEYKECFETAGEQPLAESRAILLRELRSTLVDNILVCSSGLLKHLITVGAFTSYDVQWVAAAKTMSNEVERLLDILVRKPNSAYEKFISALERSKQEHIIAEIERKKVNSTVRPELTGVLPAEELAVTERKLVDHINNSDEVQYLQNKKILLDSSNGSVSIHFKCLSVHAVDHLQMIYRNGKLNELLNHILRPSFAKLGIRSLAIEIEESQFVMCRDDFTNSTLMTVQRRKALQMAAEYWKEEIRVADVLKHLKMDALRKEAIEKAANNDDKVRVLLEIVSRQPNETFCDLLSVLRRTNQDRVADAIEYSASTVASDNVKTEDQSDVLDRIVLRDLKEKLNGIASCSICTNIFTDPRVLPCLHTFCRTCIETAYSDKVPGNAACCALCKGEFKIPDAGIKAIPRNFPMDELVSLVALSNRTIYCEHCSKDDTEAQTKLTRASGYCIYCKRLLCEQCNLTHRSSTEGCSLTSVNKQHDESMQSSRPACDYHPSEILQLFCKYCRDAICMKCYIQKHKQHDVCDIDKISEIVNEFKDEMTLNIQKMEDVADTCQELLKQLTIKKEDLLGKRASIERQIVEHRDVLTGLVAKQSKQLTEDMDSTVQGKIRRIAAVIDDISQHKERTERVVKASAELVDKGTGVAIARQFSTLCDKTSQLGNVNDLQRAVNDLVSIDISFVAANLPTLSNGSMIGQFEFNRATVIKSSRPTLTHVIPVNNRAVVGLTSFNNRLYVLRTPSEQHLEVYDIETFVLKHLLPVTELSDHSYGDCGLASCSINNYLYIGDHDKRTVHKVELSNNVFMKWNVLDNPSGLSVNAYGNVIVTFTRVNTLGEYTNKGLLVRVIRLSLYISGSLHALQLDKNSFVVSHRGQVDGISIVNGLGQVVFSYAKTPDMKHLNCPARLAVDQMSGCIIVADSGNNRILGFSPLLDSCVELPLPVDDLRGPYCLHLDESSGRLYVGESDGQRVLIFDNVLNFVVKLLKMTIAIENDTIISNRPQLL